MQQDTLLVRKMQNGDEEAMAVFVQKYYPRILQYCRYHCTDRESAQDLTQETFEKFFRNLAAYHHSGKILNYLYTIARNLCIDWGRKNKEVYIGDYSKERRAGDGRYGEAGCGNSGETGTEDRTDGIEDKVLIEEALGKLAEELREVVILHYFQELSLRETAAVLQVGLPLVKYRIGKAKEKLKEVLSCVP